MKNVPALIEISPNYFVENQGMYYEDFQVGATIKHMPGRTISSTDNTWVTLLSLNRHPLHIDHEYAENTEFGKIVVNSIFTFAVINGMTVERLSAKAVANLGWDKVKLTHPVYINDTLYAESKILSKRESKSRACQGIVKVLTVGKNQDSLTVMTMERTFLVPKRSLI